MATGDQSDFVARLTKLLPRGWFGETSSTPFLQGVLNGIAYTLADAYAWIAYARTCIRWSTSTADALDARAIDFLGGRVVRLSGETDAAFRARCLKELLRPRNTRAALIQEIIDTTGQTPVIIEPWNPGDTGAYGDVGDTTWRGLAYDTVGYYGDPELPNQVFAIVYRPALVTIPYIAGYDNGGVAGYASGLDLTYEGPLEYVSGDSSVTDDQIYAAIDSVLPAGIVCWTMITNKPPVAGDLLNIDFVIGTSTLG
ncbi:hypothetical protein ACELLULO517_15835 [Acidisoma cellulosilytica]|uniref:Uncharacterized protein n=1 Tax=Acidisoma cellulosilyticum TaxID=2802395 RepID=A0A963Z2U7_9PROT|nr:hypothetical protein [Acidisoma cellulosilyticum]MCB8881719.1 hypothetical protein [Acidisoma cellulosilyticum]